MRYLTGCSNAAVLAVAHTYNLGFMATLPVKNQWRFAPQHPYWAADNGCYTQPSTKPTKRPRKSRPFVEADWLAWLKLMQPYQRTCLFAVAPDVPGDARATLARSLPTFPKLRDLGYTIAFVAQNGLTVEMAPWDQFGALFIGGDDEFKLGHEVQPLINEANRRGLWIHQGRVNSLRRMRIGQWQGCDSADGTYIGFGPDRNLPRVLSWLRQTGEQPPLALWEAS